MPFRAGNRASYLAAIRGRGVGALSHTAPIAVVDLSALYATQRHVNEGRFVDYLTSGDLPPSDRAVRGGARVDLPIVVCLDGCLFIHDGHHRLTRAWARGDEEAPVIFVDLSR